MLLQEQATPAADGLYPERDGIYFDLCYLLPVTQIRLDGALYILHSASELRVSVDAKRRGRRAVSYTHLTLPTIPRV